MKDKTDSLTTNDLDKIANLLDERLAPVASKEDLAATKEDLKTYIHEGVETIMDELDRVENMLAEKEEVEKLKQWAVKVSEKVGIKF